MELNEKIFYSQNRKDEFLKYFCFSPKNTNKKVPLIIRVHGAGWRGNDLSVMDLSSGNDLLVQLKNGLELDAFVVAPQCHCDTWFELYDVLLEQHKCGSQDFVR